MSETENQEQNNEQSPEDQQSKVNDEVEQMKAQSTEIDENIDDSELDDQAQDLQGQLTAAQEEVAKLKDAFLRAKAEEDNVRRRAEKEVANSRKFAVEGFAKELLSVYDSLNLALNSEVDEQAQDALKGMREGVEITLKQLQTALSKFGVTEVASQVGDKLDPNLHQAMSMIESDDIESGCIINVIQAGFTMHDRLLRPAMVVVAK